MKKIILTLFFFLAPTLPVFAQAPGAPSDENFEAVQVQGYGVQASVQSLQASPGVNPEAIEPIYRLFQNWKTLAIPYPQLNPQLMILEQGLINAVLNSATFHRAQCVAANDPSEINRIQALINWISSKPELFALMGPGLNTLQEQLQKCAHFDLQFTSSMNAQGKVKVSVKAQFPLTVIADGSRLVFSGSGLLSYAAIDWPTVPGCTMTPVGDAQALTVSDASVEMIASPFQVSFSQLKFSLLVPRLTETITAHCATTVSFSQNTWSMGWRANHLQDASHVQATLYEIKDWDLSQTRVFASRVYHQGTAIVEDSTLLLIHTPQ